MQIRCTTCTKTIAIAPTGVLPPACPHCERAPVPEQLGEYKLDRLLGSGGMGEVYRAHHRELGTEVAIKLLPALSLDAIAALRGRFAREARLTAKVEHRGVVRVITSDAQDDRPYLVFELVTGATLRQLKGDGAMPPEQAARIVADTADMLAAAHAHGVLHRDIKPDNIMVEDGGQVRVLDFGIARAIVDDSPLTREGEIVGTPEYMAPEQLLGAPEATDTRTDVHALGVLLYELLTGRSPYRSANVFQTMKLVESLVPKAPTGDDLPDGLAQVAMRALEKNPDDRFESAAELAAAIRTAVPTVQPAATESRASKWPMRFAMTGCLLGAVALGIAIWFAQGENGARKEPPQPTYPILATSDDDLEPSTEDLQQLLRRGSWCEALVRAEDALIDGDDDARQTAQLAFALSHAAWLRAADLPAWLAAYDMHRRERLLGDLLEPGDGSNQKMRDLMTGDAAAWNALADSNAAPPLLRALLALPRLAEHERIQSLEALARRLPIDEPEHWLARTIERHLRKDKAGAVQAAERAWLNGAGELAVLLDAALALASADGTELERMWQRIARSDRSDCPASTLLLLHLEAHGIGHVRFEPKAAHTFPVVHQRDAAKWFVTQAESAPLLRFRLLQVAAALRAKPDFDATPWSQVSPQLRQTLEQEYERAR